MSDMNLPPRLDRFLNPDPRDAGCGEAMRMLHVYADLVDAGRDAAARYPGIGAHLRSCGPCKDDFEGLLVALRR